VSDQTQGPLDDQDMETVMPDGTTPTPQPGDADGTDGDTSDGADVDGTDV
jgi:hypothetical protein